MKLEDYLEYFESILKEPTKYPLYADEEYLHYTKMNWSRTSRWMKRFEPQHDMKNFVDAITQKQTWIIITEPWCGDAAHSVPQIFKLIQGNANITLDIQLRDDAPFLIENYLTDGGKSIPKLIIRDDKGEDIAVWGPRPAKLQDLFLSWKAEDKPFEVIKEMMQKWYNEDKGIEIQAELKALLS